MRQTVQRFFALALAVAMLFSAVGVARAQNMPTSDSVLLTANVTGVLYLSSNTDTIDFGTVDPFGVQGFGNTYDSSTLCSVATVDAGGAIYEADQRLIVTVVSSGGYALNATGTGGNNPGSFFIRSDNVNNMPTAHNVAAPRDTCNVGQPITNLGTTGGPTGDATIGGDDFTYAFQVKANSADVGLSATVGYQVTAQAI